MNTVPLGFQYKTTRNEIVCFTVAAGIHALAFWFNPIMLSGSFERPLNPLVEIGMIEENPIVNAPVEPPKKMSLMETLKDMLSKPTPSEAPHIAPQPIAAKVAAPTQPTLQDRAMQRLASTFKPSATQDDLAMQRMANQITTEKKQFALPNSAPSLQAKSFGGIRSKDLPFQVGGEDLSGSAAVPIAVGNKSAKAALSYANPTLQDASKTRVSLQSKAYSGAAPAELSSIGSGGTRNIDLAGTGGAGNAPTGAQTGSALQDKKGTGGGGLINRALMGGGRATTPALQTMNTSPLDTQLSQSDSGSRVKKSRSAYDIEGKLANRTILKKVIPQYPSWAEEQGIIGTLRLYFTVTPEGTVRGNIKVNKTTGNPQLDQIGVDALKQWIFAAQPGGNEDDIQWGIITFTFSLAS